MGVVDELAAHAGADHAVGKGDGIVAVAVRALVRPAERLAADIDPNESGESSRNPVPLDNVTCTSHNRFFPKKRWTWTCSATGRIQAAPFRAWVEVEG